ncbi:MAG: tryptophan synthase subunit alpha [Syntrophobacterales bacterium]|nr:tryptophan synthase subunit alpha [Syntrophobacterales bacterium]
MNRIEKTFAEFRKKGEKALVGFITAGDPDIERSFEIAKTLCRGGVDILELGVPFSDPTADGPVIQRSSMRALRSGMTLEKVFPFIERLRIEGIEVPVIIFSYYNPLFRYGAERFYKKATEVGADGVLVVDLPPEESEEFTGKWDGWIPGVSSFSFIRLIAPTTTRERMEGILKSASGFVYLISKLGVTGSENIISPSQSKIPHDPLDYKTIEEMVHTIKSIKEMPVCVGFGISTPEQVSMVGRIADGVVIGSAFEKAIEEHMEKPNILKVLDNMAFTFKKALKC